MHDNNEVRVDTNMSVFKAKVGEHSYELKRKGFLFFFFFLKTFLNLM